MDIEPVDQYDDPEYPRAEEAAASSRRRWIRYAILLALLSGGLAWGAQYCGKNSGQN